MNARKSEEPLEEKLWDLVYGLLDAEEEAALEDRIKSEPAVARKYAEVSLEAELVATAAKVERPPLPLHPVAPAASPARRGTLVAGRLAYSQWLNVGVSLVAVLLVAGLGWVYWPGSAERPLALNPLEKQQPQARYVLYSEISGPAHITAGTSNRFRVQTWSDDQTPVSTELRFAVTDGTKTRYQTPLVTNQEGWAEVDVPGEALQTNGKLMVTGVGSVHRAQEMEPVTAEVQVEPDQLTAHLEIDRPIIKPGETVFFRAVTLGEQSLVSQDQVKTEFEIFDPQGEPVPGSRRSDITSHGVAAGEAVLPSNAAEGYYEIAVRSPTAAFPEERLGLLVRNDGVQLLLETAVADGRGDVFAYSGAARGVALGDVGEKAVAGRAELAKSEKLDSLADRRGSLLAKNLAEGEKRKEVAGDKFKDNVTGGASVARAKEASPGPTINAPLPRKQDVAEVELKSATAPFAAKPSATAAFGSSPPAAPAAPSAVPKFARKSETSPASGPQPAGDVWFPDDADAVVVAGKKVPATEAESVEQDKLAAVEKQAEDSPARGGENNRRRSEGSPIDPQAPLSSRVAGGAPVRDEYFQKSQSQSQVANQPALQEQPVQSEHGEQLRRLVRQSETRDGLSLSSDTRWRKQHVAVELRELPREPADGEVVKLRIATTTEHGKPSSAVLGLRVVNSEVADVVENYAPLIVDREDFASDGGFRFGGGAGGGGLGGDVGGESAAKETTVTNDMDFAPARTEAFDESVASREKMVLLGRNTKQQGLGGTVPHEPVAPADPLPITYESLAAPPLENFAPWLMLAGFVGIVAVVGLLLARLPVKAWAWVPALAAAGLCLVVGGWHWNRNMSASTVAWQTPPPAAVSVENTEVRTRNLPADRPAAIAGAVASNPSPAELDVEKRSLALQDSERLPALESLKEIEANKNPGEPLANGKASEINGFAKKLYEIPADAKRESKLAEEVEEARAAPSSIPVTLFWRPRIVTDSQGVAEISIPLPKQAGRYRVLVEAHAPGRLGKGNLEIVRELPAAAVASEPAAAPPTKNESPAAPPE